MARRHHHTQIIDGNVVDHDDIEEPSPGFSDITARASTDPRFSHELLQRSTIHMTIRGGTTAIKLEKRIFRLRNGQWSVWSVQDIDGEVAGSRLTDLELLSVITSPGPGLSQEVTLGASKIPWRTGNFWITDFTLTFFLGPNGHWKMWHHIDATPLGTTRPITEAENAANVLFSDDEYFPLASL